MKTILLFVCGLFLISQISFAKDANGTALVKSTLVGNFELDNNDLKNSNVLKIPAIERHRIWLNMTNTGGAFKQLLVGYMTGATNGWDNIYDSATLDANPYVDFYSIIPNKNLTIQARALPFQITDEIPLGYKAGVAGTFTISIDHVDGLFLTQDIFLKDITTGTIHNLKNGSYSFSTLVGRFNDRFVLLYVDNTPEELMASQETEPEVTVPVVTVPIVTEPEVTTPIVTVPEVIDSVVTEPEVTTPIVTVPEVIVPIVTEPEVTTPIVTVPEAIVPIVTEPEVTTPIVIVPETPDPIVTEPEVTDPIVIVPEIPDPIAANGKSNKGKGKSVLVFVNNDQITINSDGDAIAEVYVFNMGQMQLFEKRNVNTNEFVISNLNAKKQVLIIKTQLKNGNWTTSKIVL